MRKLTPKQSAYARERAKGKGLSESYRDAGYSQAQDSGAIRRNAWNLENLSASADTIKAKIEELQRRADTGAILDRRARQALLSGILLDENETTADRLRASDQLARMSGDYTDTLRTENTVKLSYADRLDAIEDGIEEG